MANRRIVNLADKTENVIEMSSEEWDEFQTRQRPPNHRRTEKSKRQMAKEKALSKLNVLGITEQDLMDIMKG